MATTNDNNRLIKQQLEFYFSNSNLPRDKFLRALAAQSEEGYVAISELLKFEKLKKLTEDPVIVVEAIKGSELIAANSEGTHIKRTTPLPEVDTSNERTIYAKGWKSGTSIETIKDILSKFGEVLSVRIRKTKDKKNLKDSVFVEFATPEGVKAALEGPITVDDAVILTKMRQTYLDEKKELIAKAKAEKAEKAEKTENNNSKSGKGKRKETEEKEEKERVKGVLLSFKNIGGGVTREILKEIFEPYGTVAYVDFSQNEPEGVIRFDDPEVCKKALEGVESSKKEIGNQIPTLSILKDSDEVAYWEKVAEKQQERRSKSRSGGRGGRGGKRGGRGGKRQRF